ncbi:MAG: DUF4191 domain-containing protein [Candidatus Ancillula sp.]|jgi:hypothetical protein|nr:DUF4191 domain-containing protein [Candidatus Ancillula sp.]
MAKDTLKPKKEHFKTFKTIGQVFKMVHNYVPKLPLYLALGFFVPVVVFVIIALITKIYVTMIILGVLIGLVLSLFILNKLADKVGFEQIEGKPGASGAILNNVKFGGMHFDEQPVAMDPKTKDLVFRGTSRAGVILIVEGPRNRTSKMVNKEKAKLKHTLANVPVTVINVGNDEGQIPLKKLKMKVTKLKPTLTKDELKQVNQRVKALGTMQMPIPKGMDPNRMQKVSRRSLRGK